VRQGLAGDEWAKCEAHNAALGFAALSNGFASYQNSAALQQFCESFGPGHIRALPECWYARLLLPFTLAEPRWRVVVGDLHAAFGDGPHHRAAMKGY
jgi:hypothetical protein